VEDKQTELSAEDALRKEFAKQEETTTKEKWHLFICFLVFLAGFAGDVASIFLEYPLISRISRIIMCVSFLGVIYVIWSKNERRNNSNEKIIRDFLKQSKQPPP
jgi:hypothetical protein